MGGIKKKFIIDEETNLQNDKFVCSTHFNDYAIKAYIKKEGKKGYCNYCKNSSKLVLELDMVSKFIEDGLRFIYDNADEWPLPLLVFRSNAIVGLVTNN